MEGRPILVGRTRDLDDNGYFIAKLPDNKEVLVFRASGVLYVSNEGVRMKRRRWKEDRSGKK